MRKEKKYHYIYKTVNILSGKYYLGMHSTDNLNDGYLGSGKRMRYSINKHGKDNHKLIILEFVSTREELKAREKEIINLNEIAKVECMNLMVGGTGGFISVEQQRHRSRCAGKALHKKMRDNEEFRKLQCEKLSNSVQKAMDGGKMKTWKDTYNWTGKKHSEESKKKISESKKDQGKGKNNSQFGKCWITNEIINKKIYRGDVIPEGWRLGRVMN